MEKELLPAARFSNLICLIIQPDVSNSKDTHWSPLSFLLNNICKKKIQVSSWTLLILKIWSIILSSKWIRSNLSSSPAALAIQADPSLHSINKLRVPFTESPSFKFNPLTTMISLVILLTVCHTVLVMLVWRIWYWINLLSLNWLTGIFLYSHHLSAWYCIDIVGRNFVSVTHGS